MLPRRVSQSCAKVSHGQLAMTLKVEEQVLLWEFHRGGRANVTETAVTAGGRTGRPVVLRKHPVGDEKLFDPATWTLDKFQRWAIVVRAGHRGPDEAATPTQLNKACGFEATEGAGRRRLSDC